MHLFKFFKFYYSSSCSTYANSDAAPSNLIFFTSDYSLTSNPFNNIKIQCFYRSYKKDSSKLRGKTTTLYIYPQWKSNFKFNESFQSLLFSSLFPLPGVFPLFIYLLISSSHLRTKYRQPGMKIHFHNSKRKP